MINRTLTLQRAGIGHTAQLTLADIEHRRAQAIIHILQRRVTAVADDREHALEGRVQTIVQTLFQRYAVLRELAIRVELNREQVRHIHDLRHRAEILADAFFLSVRVRHLYSPAFKASL
jgi:hypothetical protein